MLSGATFDNPAAIAHSTVWLPDGFVTQPAGSVPMVRPVGTTPVTVAATGVVAWPTLLTLIV